MIIPAIHIRQPLKLLAALYVIATACGVFWQLVHNAWITGSLFRPHQESAASAGDVVFDAVWLVCIVWVALPRVERRSQA